MYQGEERPTFYKKNFRTSAVSSTKIRVKTHFCKLRCWYLVIYSVGAFFNGRGPTFLLNIYILRSISLNSNTLGCEIEDFVE